MARPIVLGVAWFRPQDWNRLREIAADRDALEESHQEWVEGATRTIRKLERQGVRPRRVIIDLDDYLAWCAARKLPLDGSSRASFAAERIRDEETRPPGDL